MTPVCGLLESIIDIEQELMERKDQSETYGDINRDEEDKKLKQMLKDLSRKK